MLKFTSADDLAAYGRNRATRSTDHVELAWSAVLRMLDEKDTSYRN